MNLKGIFSRPEKYTATKSLSPAEQAAAEWDRRTGTATVQAYNWRRVSVGLVICCIVLAVGLIVQSLKSSVVPYIVEVDRTTGAIKNVGTMTENEYVPQQAEIKYFLKEFVKNTREVPLDPIIYKSNWNKGYQFLTKDAAVKFTALA